MKPTRACAVSCGLLRWCCLIISLAALCTHAAQVYPDTLGDIDADGEITVLDLVKAINHFVGTSRLSNESAVFADVNQDGIVNENDINLIADAILKLRTLPQLPLAKILESSPAANATEVSVTRETILRFTQPLSATALIT